MIRKSLPVSGNGDVSIRRGPKPFSEQNLHKHSRLRGATMTKSICPYCAVGCSTNIFTKAGKVIDIEGNPDSPINEGTLCPKGANTFQLQSNAHRQQKVLYRAPYATEWQEKPLEWAMDRIAERVKTTRDEGFKSKSEDGLPLNAVHNMGSLGGATLDIEENYLMKKLFSAGLGIVSIENQARI